MRWYDLYTGQDSHPRRFDRPETLRDYLKRTERLSDESIEALLVSGEVEPPLARRAYRVTVLAPHSAASHDPVS